jgi:hypothetical protein
MKSGATDRTIRSWTELSIWGYGFDTPEKKNRSQFHFLIGQQF